MLAANESDAMLATAVHYLQNATRIHAGSGPFWRPQTQPLQPSLLWLVASGRRSRHWPLHTNCSDSSCCIYKHLHVRIVKLVQMQYCSLKEEGRRERPAYLYPIYR